MKNYDLILLKTFVNYKLTDLCARLEKVGFCCFFRYSGHVDAYNFHIAKSVRQYDQIVYDKTFYLDIDEPKDTYNLIQQIEKDCEELRLGIENAIH